MKAVIVAKATAAHQTGWGGAFAEGLRRHGWTATVASNAAPCDLLVLWGVRNTTAIDVQRAAGGEICILERGYVDDRFSWTSVSFGGALNGRAVFRGPHFDGSRWDRHFAHLMQPWRSRNGYALIMGQVPTDMSLKGLSPRKVWADAASKLDEMGWEVRFRPHPLASFVRVPKALAIPYGTLVDTMARAGIAVTISSNSAVDAVLAGVPTIALDERSMAWPVTGHSVAEYATPDRVEWARALAWKQWRMDEIASGECWEHVKP